MGSWPSASGNDWWRVGARRGNTYTLISIALASSPASGDVVASGQRPGYPAATEIVALIHELARQANETIVSIR